MSERIQKPWGYEEIWAQTVDYVGKIIAINKGHRLSLQYHKVKDETIRVLEGDMDLEVEHADKSPLPSGEKVKGEGVFARKIMHLRSGDTYHIPPGTKHRMATVEGCILLEVSTPQLSDVVRLEDDYGRASPKA